MIPWRAFFIIHTLSATASRYRQTKRLAERYFRAICELIACAHNSWRRPRMIIVETITLKTLRVKLPRRGAGGVRVWESGSGGL